MKAWYFPLWMKVALILGIFGCIVAGGPRGIFHCALGIVSTTFFLFVTWKAIQFFGSIVGQGAKSGPSLTAFFIILGFKIPFVVILSFYIQTLDLRQQGCFVVGLALVYSWLIGWAQVRSNSTTDLLTNGFNPTHDDSSGQD